VRFRELFRGLVPAPYRNGDAERQLYAGGLLQDAFAERMRLGAYASTPDDAPADALVYLGRDRGIRRGRNEPAAAYAARLKMHRDAHRTQGNPFAMLDQLYAYLQTAGVTLRFVDRRGNWFTRAPSGSRGWALNTGAWDWDGGSLDRWGRFWVIIYSDQGPWSAQWDPTGSGAYSGTTTATADEIAAVRAIINEWKPAGMRCEWIVVAFSSPGSTFGPETGDDPLGTWGAWGAGSPKHAVRSANARYWKGTP